MELAKLAIVHTRSSFLKLMEKAQMKKDFIFTGSGYFFFFLSILSFPDIPVHAMQWRHSSDYSREENPAGDYRCQSGVWRYEYDSGEIRHRRLLQWDTSAGYWNSGKGSTAIIADTWMHPQVGANADLTWIAPVTKTSRIKISGTVKYPGKSGDGATVTVFHVHKATVEKLWIKDLIPGQAAQFNLATTVGRGDAVILQVNAKQNNQGDRVDTDLLIESLDDRPQVRVEFIPDTSGISDHDLLQNVFPEIDTDKLCEGRISPSLVDENPRFNNMVLLRHDRGPVTITWDLGENKAELADLSIWLATGGDGNFRGQLTVSSDGKNYSPIPGTLVRKEFPIGKNPDANWSLNPEYLKDQNAHGGSHLIRYTFPPGQVKGFRYLRIESLGFKGQGCRIKEVDATIRGIMVRKSTDILTTVTPLTPAEIAVTPSVDQTTYPALKVFDLKFKEYRLVSSTSNKTLLDLKDILIPSDPAWRIVERQQTERELRSTARRTDGLMRTCRMTIDLQNRAVLQVMIELPATAPKAVPYEKTTLAFGEAMTAFDGVTYGTGAGPVFLNRNEPSGIEIGPSVPYLILPCQKEGIELHLFMPAWYDFMGRIQCFYPSRAPAVKWDMFKAVKNITVDSASESGRWRETPGTFKPGEKLTYTVNLAAMPISPPTLGQRDIEQSKEIFQPMVTIEMGLPNQHVPGQPRILEREKMKFIGFKLPEPVKEKIGNQISLWHTWDSAKGLDTFVKAGVGMVMLHSEYIDVSHGVSFNGKYDQSPPGFQTLLDNIERRGMKTVFWFSPRGFLQTEWVGRPKDLLVEQHPDWFFKEAHWFGKYRTVNFFKSEPNQWILAKFKQDVTQYPQIGGYILDSFAGGGGCLIGGNPVETGVRCERRRLHDFKNTLRQSGPDKILMANFTTPMYDDFDDYDYVVTEHPPMMFMNEVSGGRTMGHSFIVHTRWGQLYFWWAILGHMYYNFCDYDQAFGWLGPGGVGLLEGNEAPFKSIDNEFAPLWYIMGKGTRVYGAQVAPGIRQIEARMPDGSMAVILCSLSARTANLQVMPQKVEKGQYQVTLTADTALNHQELSAKPFTIDLTRQPGFNIKDLPPYSTLVFRFNKMK